LGRRDHYSVQHFKTLATKPKPKISLREGEGKSLKKKFTRAKKRNEEKRLRLRTQHRKTQNVGAEHPFISSMLVSKFNALKLVAKCVPMKLFYQKF